MNNQTNHDNKTLEGTYPSKEDYKNFIGHLGSEISLMLDLIETYIDKFNKEDKDADAHFETCVRCLSKNLQFADMILAKIYKNWMGRMEELMHFIPKEAPTDKEENPRH